MNTLYSLDDEEEGSERPEPLPRYNPKIHLVNLGALSIGQAAELTLTGLLSDDWKSSPVTTRIWGLDGVDSNPTQV